MEHLNRFVGGVQVVIFAVFTVASVIATYLLPSDSSRTLAILLLGGAALFPVEYRRAIVEEGSQEGSQKHYIWMPYLLIGFCELAIIIFDRFKNK